MLLIDLEQGRIIEDAELKAELSGAQPYAEWLDKAQYKLEDLDHIEPELRAVRKHATRLLLRQQDFGYTQADIASFLVPQMLAGGRAEDRRVGTRSYSTCRSRRWTCK